MPNVSPSRAHVGTTSAARAPICSFTAATQSRMFTSFGRVPGLPVVRRVPLGLRAEQIDLVHHDHDRRHSQVRLAVEPRLQPVEQVDVRLVGRGLVAGVTSRIRSASRDASTAAAKSSSLTRLAVAARVEQAHRLAAGERQCRSACRSGTGRRSTVAACLPSSAFDEARLPGLHRPEDREGDRLSARALFRLRPGVCTSPARSLGRRFLVLREDLAVALARRP